MQIQQSQGPWNRMEGLFRLPNFRVQTAGYLTGTHTQSIEASQTQAHHSAFCLMQAACYATALCISVFLGF